MLHRAAFDAQNDVLRDGSQNRDDFFPIDDAVAASATDRGAHHLAALRRRLLERYVLGVHMDNAIFDPFQPRNRVEPAEVRVAGVEVRADARGVDEVQNAVVTLQTKGVSLVRFEADFDSAPLANLRRLFDRILDENEVLFGGRPRLLVAFVRVNNRRAAFVSEARGLL